MSESYSVDDRGNIAQFYEAVSGDIVATLDREAGATANQLAWDGGPEVTAWAVAKGWSEIAVLAKLNAALAALRLWMELHDIECMDADLEIAAVLATESVLAKEGT